MPRPTRPAREANWASGRLGKGAAGAAGASLATSSSDAAIEPPRRRERRSSHDIMLRKGAGSEGTAANLKRTAAKQKDTGRMAKVTRKNLDSNYMTQRAAALPPTVALTETSEKSVLEQLFDILAEHKVRGQRSHAHSAYSCQMHAPLSAFTRAARTYMHTHACTCTLSAQRTHTARAGVHLHACHPHRCG